MRLGTRLGTRGVDLIGRYSNRASWIERVPSVPKVATSNRTTTVRTRGAAARRLSSQQVTDLVKAYQDGQTVYVLADRFGIHRTTVSAHLHREGVCLRRQGLAPDDIAHAERLYVEGWSLARIGGRFNVDAHTVRRVLKAGGVRMRDTHARER